MNWWDGEDRSDDGKREQLTEMIQLVEFHSLFCAAVGAVDRRVPVLQYVMK